MLNSVGHCLGCTLDQKAADVESQLRRMYRCQVSANGIIMPIKITEAQTPAVAFSVPDEMKIGLLAPDTELVSEYPLPITTTQIDETPGTTAEKFVLKDWIKKNPLAAGGIGLGLLYFITKK